MNYIVLTIFLLIFLLSPFAKAEDTIKILMLKNPYAPFPSEQAEHLESLTGKVLINGQSYAGSLDIMRDDNGLYVINNLPFEKYIEGVVASETGKDWEFEALKAQAIVSRTYALYYKIHNAGKNFHLSSTELHQVYKGLNTYPLITYAVKVTRGKILTYENLPIKAFFHTSCEGKTERPEEVWEESYPYLRSVDCNTQNTPYESWQRKFTHQEIEKAIGINGLKDIEISSYTASGRAKTLKIIIKTDEVSKKEINVKAMDLRKLLGYKELPSTHFSLSKTNKDVIFSGKGFGHAVGLSQWGALEMARQGKNYREILEHYYPGTTIQKNKEWYSRVIEKND